MKNAKLLAAFAVGTLTLAATSPAKAQNIGSFNRGDITKIDVGGVNINVGGSDDQGDSSAVTGSRPDLAGVPDLTKGMKAPGMDVGTDTVQKATVSYSNSIGSSDSFSVGAMTNIGATASATSTPDYDVTSKSVFGIGGDSAAAASTINQTIGTGGTLPNTDASITGSFNKAYTPDKIKNDVTVTGIGTAAAVTAANTSQFDTSIQKTQVEKPTSKDDLLNSGAGSANGSAAGSVGTTTTASANSSQFVSSFAQAY